MKNKKIVLLLSSILSLNLFGCSKVQNIVEDMKTITQKDETSPTVDENGNVVSEDNSIQSTSYDRQERIDSYQLENPNLSYEECVKRVYMNLDLEPYSQTVEVEDLDSYVMLVNKYSGLPSNYTPNDLTTIDGGVQVRAYVAQRFKELQQMCSNFGLSVTGWSAFRSYDYQYSLYHNGVSNYGLEYAEKYWTHPGFSEHQTGLTVDVCLDGDQSDLDAARYNPNYQQFLECLHMCGFILRYGDDKQEYTQIAPESWHIRYVGDELATYLYSNNLSLDEFYGMLDAGMISWDDISSDDELDLEELNNKPVYTFD